MRMCFPPFLFLLPRGNTEPRFVRINTNVLDLEGAKRLLAEEQWMLVEERFADYGAFIERVKALADAEYMEDFHFPDLLVFPNSAKSFWSRSTHLHDQFLLQNKVRTERERERE